MMTMKWVLIPLFLNLGRVQADSSKHWSTRIEELLTNKTTSTSVLALSDDWQTGGDWNGRYGDYAWVLCGMSGAWDYSGQGFRVQSSGLRGQRSEVRGQRSGFKKI